MGEWIDVLAYAALIVALWGWLPAWGSRVAVGMVAHRNPDWIAGHPEIERRLAESRWFHLSCVLWGVLSLAALVVFQLGAWPELFAFLGDTPRWEALKDLNSLLLIVGLAYLAGCSLLLYRWLHANVPLASHRQATLERRSIDDHVPRNFQYVVYGVLVLHLAVWIAVGVMGLYTTHAFWGAMAFQFVITGLCVFFAIGAVRRSPGAIDRSLGPGYRQTEVRVAFAAQLLPLLNGAVRLYEQVSNTPPEITERFLHLGVVAVVVALMIAFIVRLRKPNDSAPARWPRSSASLRALTRGAHRASSVVPPDRQRSARTPR